MGDRVQLTPGTRSARGFSEHVPGACGLLADKPSSVRVQHSSWPSTMREKTPVAPTSRPSDTVPASSAEVVPSSTQATSCSDPRSSSRTPWARRVSRRTAAVSPARSMPRTRCRRGSPRASPATTRCSPGERRGPRARSRTLAERANEPARGREGQPRTEWRDEVPPWSRPDHDPQARRRPTSSRPSTASGAARHPLRKRSAMRSDAAPVGSSISDGARLRSR